MNLQAPKFDFKKMEDEKSLLLWITGHNTKLIFAQRWLFWSAEHEAGNKYLNSKD